MSEEKETTKIIYNRNPFIPKGRLNRGHYFLYMMLLNLISKISEYDLSVNAASASATLLSYVALLLTLFVIKNRIYDITLSNKNSWIWSVAYVVALLYLFGVKPEWQYIMVPFGFLLLCLDSKGLNIEDNNVNDKNIDSKVSKSNNKYSQKLCAFLSSINYKKGLKRIAIIIGYFVFALVGLGIGSDTSFYAAIIGGVIGVFAFKYLIIGIKWLIDGFKKD